MTVKIAIASEDGVTIARHFGKTPYFAIFTIENNKVIDNELRANTFTSHAGNNHNHNRNRNCGHTGAFGNQNHMHNQNHACGENVINGLSDCQAVICGGAGQKLVSALLNSGLELIITHFSGVEDSINAYLRGDLTTTVKPCAGHGHR